MLAERGAGRRRWLSVYKHILLRAMQIGLKGNFVASPLLAEAPNLAKGDLQQSPFTVSLKIKAKAVWDDRLADHVDGHRTSRSCGSSRQTRT